MKQISTQLFEIYKLETFYLDSFDSNVDLNLILPKPLPLRSLQVIPPTCLVLPKQAPWTGV